MEIRHFLVQNPQTKQGMDQRGNSSLSKKVPCLFAKWWKLTWALVFEANAANPPHVLFCLVWGDTTKIFFFSLSSVLTDHPYVPTFMNVCFWFTVFVTKMISKASFLFEQPAIRNDLDKTANCLLILPHFLSKHDVWVFGLKLFSLLTGWSQLQ